MSANSKIEWTDHTFNPWEGCQKTGSKGCDNCYAETRNARFGGGVAINWGPHAPRRRTSTANWALPLRWNAQAMAFLAQHGRRQRVFCASLADWLDNAVDIEWLIDLLALIRLTPDLDWLMLSKRIGIWRNRLEAAAEALRDRLERASEATVALLRWIERWLAGDAPPNVWIGATICDQPEADRDLPKLLAVPARVRFLSIEPLLGAISFEGMWVKHPNPAVHINMLEELDWVIVGGESGPGARPMHPDWARSLQEQCEATGVPFLFKQWGEWSQAWGAGTHLVYLDGRCIEGTHDHPDAWQQRTAEVMRRVGKKNTGRLLDGLEWNEVPR